jgi:hypothetical protein
MNRRGFLPAFGGGQLIEVQSPLAACHSVFTAPMERAPSSACVNIEQPETPFAVHCSEFGVWSPDRFCLLTSYLTGPRRTFERKCVPILD